MIAGTSACQHQTQKHHGTGFAGPLVLPPEGGGAKRRGGDSYSIPSSWILRVMVLRPMPSL